MVVPIDYSEIRLLFLIIFAIVGLMRGWFKEGITALFTAGLAILVWRPEIARTIIDAINQVIELFLSFFRAGFSLDPGEIAAQTVQQEPILDPDSYRLYIVVMVVLLIFSYIIGEVTFKGRQTALGRLIGGVLGVFNGWIIVALVMEYLKIGAETKGVSAQAGEFAIGVTNVPTSNFMAGPAVIFIFVVVIGVVALFVAGDRLKLPLK